MKLLGGRKNRTNRRVKKGKTANKKGGKRARTNRRRTVRRKQAGGMLGTMSSVAKTALVPFGLFAAQRLLRKSKKTGRK
jgi:hypothetical protein